MRIKPVCERKHRAEVAVELRNSFDFWQNLRVHGFLIHLRCSVISYFSFLVSKISPFPVSGLAKLLLFEVSVGEMFGDFHTTEILVEVAMTNFWCVLHRGT